MVGHEKGSECPRTDFGSANFKPIEGAALPPRHGVALRLVGVLQRAFYASFRAKEYCCGRCCRHSRHDGVSKGDAPSASQKRRYLK